MGVLHARTTSHACLPTHSTWNVAAALATWLAIASWNLVTGRSVRVVHISKALHATHSALSNGQTGHRDGRKRSWAPGGRLLFLITLCLSLSALSLNLSSHLLLLHSSLLFLGSCLLLLLLGFLLGGESCFNLSSLSLLLFLNPLLFILLLEVFLLLGGLLCLLICDLFVLHNCFLCLVVSFVLRLGRLSSSLTLEHVSSSGHQA